MSGYTILTTAMDEGRPFEREDILLGFASGFCLEALMTTYRFESNSMKVTHDLSLPV